MGELLTRVWQKWRFSAPKTHLWLIKVWFSASTFVVKIATFAKPETVNIPPCPNRMPNPNHLILFLLTFLFSQCQPAHQKNVKSGNSIQDSLNAYLTSNQSISKELAKRLFDFELYKTDKLFVKEIRPKTNSLYPVITVYHTIEEDKEKQYTNLTLYTEEWKLLLTCSVEYEMSWDLFRQEYRFINDSTLKFIEYNGITYDNDSTIKSTYLVRLNKTKGLDTLKTEIDTLR